MGVFVHQYLFLNVSWKGKHTAGAFDWNPAWCKEDICHDLVQHSSPPSISNNRCRCSRSSNILRDSFAKIRFAFIYPSNRALNIELARIPELVSNPTVGALRMQFWRDNLTRTFAHTPPKEPVAILLHHALQLLQDRHPGISTSVMKGWSMKVINAREQYMDNRPYTSMEGLETYAENTYSTLMYLPLLAFPPPPNHHNNSSALGGGGSGPRQGSVVLPLDIMAQAGVKEEEI